MEIPNKRELQQIAFNHSSDIDFKDFMDKKLTAKTHSYQTNITIENQGKNK